MLIHNKDDIEFVTEFPCFLGHPVSKRNPTRTSLNKQRSCNNSERSRDSWQSGSIYRGKLIYFCKRP